MGNGAEGDYRHAAFESHLLSFAATKIFHNHELKFGMEGRLLRVNDSESSTENWDFNVQRQLPGDVLVDAAYVGSHGLHLNEGGENDFNINQLTPQALALGTQLQQTVPNPFYGIIPTGALAAKNVAESYLLSPYPQFLAVDASYPTGGYTIYHSFQLKVEKRFSHGLNALLAYTGQKLIDDYSIISNVGTGAGIQNIYNTAGERSVSSNDISQRLVISGGYVLPFGRGKSFGKNWGRPLDAALGGWQVNAIATYQTGLPLGGHHAEHVEFEQEQPAPQQ